jgi:hypothetical protein
MKDDKFGGRGWIQGLRVFENNGGSKWGMSKIMRGIYKVGNTSFQSD